MPCIMGVYVPVDEKTKPNPYLDVPRRDIKVSPKLTLTMINPAYMTRQLSELLALKKGVYFHITSLRPLNPQNKASLLERQALLSFEHGRQSVGFYVRTSKGKVYFYMAPLITEDVCLQCHAEQGYKKGDVRGGISVYVPLANGSSLGHFSWSYLGIGMTGLFLIFLFFKKLDKAYVQLHSQAKRDSLTGLYNRRAFYDVFARDFEVAGREGFDYAVIMLDVDWFKAYNDHFGHLEGDRCLKKIALALEHSVKRPGDICARYGGEEFVIALPHTGLSGGMKVAEKARQAVLALHLPHAPSVQVPVVSVSLGVAALKASCARDQEDLLNKADHALYLAKERGRNRVEAWEEA